MPTLSRRDAHGQILKFPFERTLNMLPNDARLEWLYRVLDAHPNVAKKQIILEASSPHIGFIDDRTATILIDALGLCEM